MGSNLQLNSQIENYINNYSIDLHPVQKEIIKYNEKLGEIKKMQISVSQCHFLHFIIKITNPKKYFGNWYIYRVKYFNYGLGIK